MLEAQEDLQLKKNSESGDQNEATGPGQAAAAELQQAIAEASRSQNEAIAQLVDQQTTMLSEIKQIDGKQGQVDQMVSETKDAQSAFISEQHEVTTELKQTQSSLVTELRELKESQADFQNSLREEVSRMQATAPSGGNSEEMMAGLQTIMQQITSQMSAQQEQMQNAIFER